MPVNFCSICSIESSGITSIVLCIVLWQSHHKLNSAFCRVFQQFSKYEFYFVIYVVSRGKFRDFPHSLLKF